MYSDYDPSLRIGSALFGYTISVAGPHHLVPYLVLPILNRAGPHNHGGFTLVSPKGIYTGHHEKV